MPKLLYVLYQSQEPITSGADDQTLFKLDLAHQLRRSFIQLVSLPMTIPHPIHKQRRTAGPHPLQHRLAECDQSQKLPQHLQPELNEELTIEYGCKTSAAGINVKAIVHLRRAGTLGLLP